MPHIVQLYDCFYEEGRVYLVLELMDWGSLETLLKLQSQNMPAVCMHEGVLAVILRSVLSALSFLHDQQKIIHRDLKPGNIVINSKGVVKLSDFGVSRALDKEAKGISWVGTASYMSPERLEGKEYSHKADIWSLGIIALECGMGHHPYMRSDGLETVFFELMQKVLIDPAPIPTGAQFSPQYIEFIQVCLAKQDQQRSSASQLLHHPFLQMHMDKNESFVLQWLQLFPAPSTQRSLIDDAMPFVLPVKYQLYV